jgi:hypothetical protein
MGGRGKKRRLWEPINKRDDRSDRHRKIRRLFHAFQMERDWKIKMQALTHCTHNVHARLRSIANVNEGYLRDAFCVPHAAGPNAPVTVQRRGDCFSNDSADYAELNYQESSKLCKASILCAFTVFQVNGCDLGLRLTHPCLCMHNGPAA